MRVYQVMNSEPIAVDIEDDVDDAYELMHEHSLAQLPVLEDGRLIGIVKEDAIRAGLEPDQGLGPTDLSELTVGMLLQREFVCCLPATSIGEAGAAMDASDTDHIYVTTTDGRLLGVVDDTDLVDWYGDAETDAALTEWLPLARRYAAEHSGSANTHAR